MLSVSNNPIMLIVLKLRVANKPIMLSVLLLSVANEPIMLNVAPLEAVMLRVVEPFEEIVASYDSSKFRYPFKTIFLSDFFQSCQADTSKKNLLFKQMCPIQIVTAGL